MMKNNIHSIIQSITGLNSDSYTDDSDLFETGVLDSMGYMELLVKIEEMLSLKISITEVSREDMSTCNKIIQTLHKLK